MSGSLKMDIGSQTPWRGGMGASKGKVHRVFSASSQLLIAATVVVFRCEHLQIGLLLLLPAHQCNKQHP